MKIVKAIECKNTFLSRLQQVICGVSLKFSQSKGCYFSVVTNNFCNTVVSIKRKLRNRRIGRINDPVFDFITILLLNRLIINLRGFLKTHVH